MTHYLIRECSLIAGVLLLFQLVAIECLLQCPTNIPKECQCQNEPFEVNCTKNNEFISFRSIYIDIFEVQHNTLILKCENVTDGEIYNLLNFDSNYADKLNNRDIRLMISFCPISIVTPFGNSVIEHSNVKSFHFQTYNTTILREIVPDLQIKMIQLQIYNYTGVTMEEDIFNKYINVENLRIHGNNLITLPANIFTRLASLKYFMLVKYGMNPGYSGQMALPENIFENQTKLEDMLIFGCNLITLPENIFGKIKNVTNINIMNNNLTSLPGNIFKGLTKVIWMTVTGNQLTTLPANIFKRQTKMISLGINENQLKTLPEYIFNGLNKLKRLNLSANSLAILPQNIFMELTKLEELEIYGNVLLRLPEHIFDNTTNLKMLNLTENNLATLPQNIFDHATELKQLALSENKLMVLSERIFRNQTNLEQLYLNWNMLKTLPKDIFNGLTKLKELKLGNNPWVCDCDFQAIVNKYRNILDMDDIECEDGVLVRDILSTC